MKIELKLKSNEEMTRLALGDISPILAPPKGAFGGCVGASLAMGGVSLFLAIC